MSNTCTTTIHNSVYSPIINISWKSEFKFKLVKGHRIKQYEITIKVNQRTSDMETAAYVTWRLLHSGKDCLEIVRHYSTTFVTVDITNHREHPILMRTVMKLIKAFNLFYKQNLSE